MRIAHIKYNSFDIWRARFSNDKADIVLEHNFVGILILNSDLMRKKLPKTRIHSRSSSDEEDARSNTRWNQKGKNGNKIKHYTHFVYLQLLRFAAITHLTHTPFHPIIDNNNGRVKPAETSSGSSDYHLQQYTANECNQYHLCVPCVYRVCIVLQNILPFACFLLAKKKTQSRRMNSNSLICV